MFQFGKLAIQSTVSTMGTIAIAAQARPITMIGAMEPESAALCISMMGWITIFKPLFWVLSFVPAYGMRAAGDVKFSMLISTVSMWMCRVSLCVFLVKGFGFGPMAVWIGMFSDWAIRGVIFTWRFHSRKWLSYKVV